MTGYIPTQYHHGGGLGGSAVFFALLDFFAIVDGFRGTYQTPCPGILYASGRPVVALQAPIG